MSAAPPLAGVIGWPVGHSRSPRLHGHWLRRYHIDGYYVPIALSPEAFEPGLRSLHRLCPVVHYLGSYPRIDGQRAEVREDFADHAYDDAREWIERLSGMITPTDPATEI